MRGSNASVETFDKNGLGAKKPTSKRNAAIIGMAAQQGRVAKNVFVAGTIFILSSSPGSKSAGMKSPCLGNRQKHKI